MDPVPGSHEFWASIIDPLCSYMADLDPSEAAAYATVLAEQKYQIRHMKKLTTEKLLDLGIEEGHCEAILDSVEAFVTDFEARATEQLDELTFTAAESDAYFQDLMASNRGEEQSRESHSSVQEYEPSESCEPRGSVNSIASAASYYAAEEDEEGEDELASHHVAGDSERPLSPRPIMGDLKAQQRHELAMQKAAKLAQLRKQRLAEAGVVKPLASAPKTGQPDDQAKARISKQLAKAKTLGEARKKKADEPQKIAPRPQGSGTIDEKTQARLDAAMEKARLLAVKRMNSGTMELPSPSHASSSSPPPPPPSTSASGSMKMDPRTQARLEKEMAKAKALAAARLAKIESEKVVDEIPPLPPPDAVLTPEMQARLGADIAKAKARAEALHQRKLQQAAEENKKKELREKPEVIEEDPRVLEKRKQELEAIKQRVAEREREKRNLKLQAESSRSVAAPPPPTRTRASSAASTPTPSKIVVSKVTQEEETTGRANATTATTAAAVPKNTERIQQRTVEKKPAEHNNESEAKDSKGPEQAGLPPPQLAPKEATAESILDALVGSDEEEEAKRPIAVETAKPAPKPKPAPVKKPPPPEPARERINSADFYLAPLEVVGAAPQCMLCDAAPADVYCEDCKESFCNVNQCNRDSHIKIGKARHYKRLYQVRKKLVSLLVNCYICGQQFSVASLAIHYDTCRVTRKLGLRELPANLRPPITIEVPQLPIPDEATATNAEVKAFNEEALATYRKFNMIACPGCDRKFEPDRIQKHMKGCDNLKT